MPLNTFHPSSWPWAADRSSMMLVSRMLAWTMKAKSANHASG
jgi:hypothetical protein